jgi:hypothetical protein
MTWNNRYGKVKFLLCLIKHHAMKMYWGSKDTDTFILNFDTTWRLVASFAHRPLYLYEKSSQHPLDRRLSEPQSRQTAET